jgi:hypothetical protein
MVMLILPQTTLSIRDPMPTPLQTMLGVSVAMLILLPTLELRR